MKRFTETTKWRDPWFRRLSFQSKLLFLWLTDHCDNSGVVDIDLEAASFDIGITIKEKQIAELQDRLQTLPSGKVWIKKFIPFQYGNVLSDKCPPHLRIIETLRSHGLSYPDSLTESNTHTTTLPTRVVTTLKEEEREEDQEKEREQGDARGETYSTDSRVALHWLNEKSGRNFRETSTSLGPINARLKEEGVSIEGVKKMIERQCARWKGTKQEEYLTPSTLFRPENFNNYYSAIDLPLAIDQNLKSVGSMTEAELLIHVLG